MFRRSTRTLRLITAIVSAAALTLAGAPAHSELAPAPTAMTATNDSNPIVESNDWSKLAPPRIEGTIAVNQSLKARHTNSNTPGLEFTRGHKIEHQWFKDGKLSQTTPTSMPIRLFKQDAGKILEVRTVYLVDNYETRFLDFHYSPKTDPVKIIGLPTKVGTVALSGTPKNNESLYMSWRGWQPSSRAAVTWYANGTLLKGETKEQLNLNPSHVGMTITGQVTFTKLGYDTKTGTTRGVRVAPATLRSAKPTISDTAQVGKRLIAKPGKWNSGTKFSYQWNVNGKAIKSATRSTYTPTAGARNKKITVKVTGSKSGYTTTSKTSSNTKAVAAGKLATKKPVISGTAQVGKKLTPGKWTAGTKFSYQWNANGKKIKGATTKTYKLKKADRKKIITVKITGKRYGYATASQTSKATKIK